MTNLDKVRLLSNGDIELIRKILLAIEAGPRGAELTIPGYDGETIGYNAYLMNHVGLITASTVEFLSERPVATASGLTSEGYRVLNVVRHERTWRHSLALMDGAGYMSPSTRLWAILKAAYIR
jgi:hypothetical protein